MDEPARLRPRLSDYRELAVADLMRSSSSSSSSSGSSSNHRAEDVSPTRVRKRAYTSQEQVKHSPQLRLRRLYSNLFPYPRSYLI